MAFLHDLVANPTIKGTTFLGHKDALQPFLYTCTNHRNHPPSIAKILAFLSTHFGLVNKILYTLWQGYSTRAALLIEKSAICELKTC